MLNELRAAMLSYRDVFISAITATKYALTDMKFTSSPMETAVLQSEFHKNSIFVQWLKKK